MQVDNSSRGEGWIGRWIGMESWLDVAQVDVCRHGRGECVARISEGDEGTCGVNEGVVAVSEGRRGGLESFQVVCRGRDACFGHDDNIDGEGLTYNQQGETEGERGGALTRTDSKKGNQSKNEGEEKERNIKRMRWERSGSGGGGGGGNGGDDGGGGGSG